MRITAGEEGLRGLMHSRSDLEVVFKKPRVSHVNNVMFNLNCSHQRSSENQYNNLTYMEEKEAVHLCEKTTEMSFLGVG